MCEMCSRFLDKKVVFVEVSQFRLTRDKKKIKYNTFYMLYIVLILRLFLVFFGMSRGSRYWLVKCPQLMYINYGSPPKITSGVFSTKHKLCYREIKSLSDWKILI